MRRPLILLAAAVVLAVCVGQGLRNGWPVALVAVAGIASAALGLTAVDKLDRATARAAAVPAPEHAIAVMGRAVAAATVAAALEDGEVAGRWETWPEVGEHDWRRVEAQVQTIVNRLAVPEGELLAAYRALAARADHDPDNAGRHIEGV